MIQDPYRKLKEVEFIQGVGWHMNRQALLLWMLQDAEQNDHAYQLQIEGESDPDSLLREDLHVLGGDQVDILDSIPPDPEKAIPLLRSHYKDNVTLVSRVLNHYFPEQYIFYRVSKLEEEIFRSFDFLSSILPEFEFPFTSVGRRGFDKYLAVNDVLMSFFRNLYPDLEDPHPRISWFLYQGLGHLFLEKSDYTRYWIMVTTKKYFEGPEGLDSNDILEWSGRKEMQAGDLVFMYRASPRMAITDIFEVIGEPRFDPWGGWDGFWVDIERVCRIEDIPFATLRDDSVLGNWSIVRKKLMGVRTDPVPHSIYNRLLEKIPGDTNSSYGLIPEPTAAEGSSGQFVSEAEFEDRVIEPLLKRWSLDYQRQYRCRFRLGSQDYSGRVDFYVSDAKGPIALFENKFKILNEKDLKLAADQGKSYALMLGLPCFVVASPEGMWIYSLQRHVETLEEHVPLNELSAREENIRRVLLKLGSE